MHSMILRTVSPIVLHLTLVFSLYLLLYGHNQPGGGFIAGLMASVGIVLQWVTFDSQEGNRRFGWPWDKFFAGGLAVSALVGVIGLILGAYLKSAHFEIYVPLIGEVEILTAFLFDIGVYGVVVGVTMTILVSLSITANDEEN